MDRILYSFTNLPSPSSLLCVSATIQIGENVKISTYNTIVLKCRQLIFENQDVIAYPELDQSYSVVIIVKENYYAEGKLKDMLRKYNLRITGPPTAVSRYTYEKCCYYTILTKIAPQWNTIANYFVKGRNFLMNNSPTDCNYLTIRIHDSGETSFIFNTGRVKLPTMSLKSLDLSYKHIQNLKNHQCSAVPENECRPVRVLPSLKKGKIIGISNNLSHSKTFSEYKYMRRYWKNTYGYRLPEVDTDIVYFDIKFFDGSPIFTYPIICVRPYNPVFLKKINSEDIVHEFVADMIKAVPIILGENYKTPVFSQPNIGLSSATQLLNNRAMMYTQGNHYEFNQNISDTQNSAIVLMKTLSTQFHKTGTATQVQDKIAITQFVRELERQESLYGEDENDPPEQTNNTNENKIKDDPTRPDKIKEARLKEYNEPSEQTNVTNNKEDTPTKPDVQPMDTKLENTNKNSIANKNISIEINKIVKVNQDIVKKVRIDDKQSSGSSNEKGKQILKRKMETSRDRSLRRYKSLNIKIESQNEDFSDKKKKAN